MHKQPLFSILVANYNNGEYLEEMLESIYQQTYTNWEIIIVDDCSTDNSDSIYAKLTDKRIKIIRNEQNSGCGYTKRVAAAQAKGELISYIDPDDTITPDALQILVDAHAQHLNASIVHATMYHCDQDLNVLGIIDWIGAIPLGSNNLFADKIAPLAAIKRAAYEKTAGIDVTYKRAVDKDLYYKIEEVGEVVFINQALYYYRHHQGGISTTNNRLKASLWRIKAMTDAYERRKSMPHIKNITPWIIRKRFIGIHLFEAKHALYKGKIGKAITYIIKGLISKPADVIKSGLA